MVARLLSCVFAVWTHIVKPKTRLDAEAGPVLLQGTRLIYYNEDSEILLLAIPGAIPDHFQAYHLGFDAGINAVPTSAVVISHPDGSPKVISYVNSR